MRTKKIVKRKEVVFDMEQWYKVTTRADSVHMNISQYITRMAVDGQILKLENAESRNIILALNRIGVSINQIARKANETHSIYKDDIEFIKKEHEDICLILNQYLSALRLTEVSLT